MGYDDAVQPSPAEYRLRFDPSHLDDVRRQLADWGQPLCDIRTEAIHVGDEALLRLPAALANLPDAPGPVNLVMDHTFMTRGGAPLKPMVVEMLRRRLPAVQVHVLGEPRQTLFASIELARELADRLTGPAVVALGSGTITDLAKHAVHLRRQPACKLVVVPTACTVTGYTCPMAVLAVRGVKRTMPSRWPDVVLADLQTLADAPAEMTAAGFGDMLARGVACADWYLANALGMDETFSRLPYDMLANSEQFLLRFAEAIGGQAPAAIRALIDALLLAGLAMSVVNQTTPISGWEHVISHYLDLRASACGMPVELHGRQVGLATLAAAAAYRQLLDQFDPRARQPSVSDDEQARAQIIRHFGRFDPASRGLAEEIWEDYHSKLSTWREQVSGWSQFARRWREEIRPELAAWVRDPAALARAARAAGLPASLGDLTAKAQGCWAAEAMAHAHLVRKRFTLGDLLSAVGWLTPANIARWLTPRV